MFWILGVNKRFLKYIRPLNPKKKSILADSKLNTKIFLKNLDIPHPILFDFIKTRKQLHWYDFSSFAWKDFVIKPNRWSKWNWIGICHMIDSQTVVMSWKTMSINEFKKHLTDILDWKYSSLTQWKDIVLIEDKIIPWEDFSFFCEFWLADIRLISMNMIPTMAMLRYPTAESGWTANIAKWWIGFWIDIWSWRISTMFYKRKIYNKNFPEEFKDFYNKTVPYWDDILLYSSQIQYFTNIWYLGLDRIIAKNGPNLIEINARAWMEIQLVNDEWLENRLKKISWMQINSPSKGVEIWKTIFSKKKTNPTIQKDMIYLEQPWILKNEDFLKNVIIKADIEHSANFASKLVIPDFDKSYTIKIQDLTLDNIKFIENNKMWNIVSLWTSQLEDFILIPKKRDIKDFSIWKKEFIQEWEEWILEELDNDLDKVSKKLNISRIVSPINYIQELESFITWNWNYNPKFEYKYPTDKKLDSIKENLENIREKYFDVKSEYKSNLLKLFKEKYEEMTYKLDLIIAYKKQDFSQIEKLNILLYWKIDENLANFSKEKIWFFGQDKSTLWRLLKIDEIHKIVKKRAQKLWLQNIKINILDSMSARINIRRWKDVSVNILRSSLIYEKEIEMILAHELDVHLMRYLNWKLTWWKILQNGTGFYITHEEWLAIRNSKRFEPKDYDKNIMYEKYFLIKKAMETDFVWLANLIRAMYPDKSLLSIFRRTLRLKKWVQNTAFKWEWTAYYKWKIYLDGFLATKQRIEDGWNYLDLFRWKHKIQDIKYFQETLLKDQ